MNATLRNPLNLLSFLILSILCWSCGSRQEKTLVLTQDEAEEIAAKGEHVSMTMARSLKAKLTRAIDSAGLTSAIEVCKTIAIPLTQETGTAAGEGITLKRTSTRYRNPANAPDEIDKQALDHFEDMIARNESIPPQYLRKELEEDDTVYYYFKPMRVEALCLLCHGDETTLSPEVKPILDELYPGDKATGYQEGDFRGLIRVKITPN